MYYAGIDAHATYLMVAVVDRTGQRVLAPSRVWVRSPQKLLEILQPFRPLQLVVETCAFWPWLYDLLLPEGIGFVLAHAKRLRAIAEADHKSDEVDAELLARMLQAGLIPQVHPKSAELRERARNDVWTPSGDPRRYRSGTAATAALSLDSRQAEHAVLRYGRLEDRVDGRSAAGLGTYLPGRAGGADPPERAARLPGYYGR